jgi:hypothetical protein
MTFGALRSGLRSAVSPSEMRYSATGPRLALLVGPVELVGRFAVVTAGIEQLHRYPLTRAPTAAVGRLQCVVFTGRLALSFRDVAPPRYCRAIA